MLQLYQSDIKRILADLTESVVRAIHAKAAAYTRSGADWLRAGVGVGNLQVSVTASPMLVALRDSLFHMHKHLRANLFAQLWLHVAKALDKFLYEEVCVRVCVCVVLVMLANWPCVIKSNAMEIQYSS